MFFYPFLLQYAYNAVDLGTAFPPHLLMSWCKSAYKRESGRIFAIYKHAQSSVGRSTGPFPISHCLGVYKRV